MIGNTGDQQENRGHADGETADGVQYQRQFEQGLTNALVKALEESGRDSWKRVPAGAQILQCHDSRLFLRAFGGMFYGMFSYGVCICTRRPPNSN
jgi:hypothetical protein